MCLTICADDALYVGKVGMSVLVKGLAMDFVRQGRNEMAVTSIWPASVCTLVLILFCSYVCEELLTALLSSRLNQQLQSIIRDLTHPTKRI